MYIVKSKGLNIYSSYLIHIFMVTWLIHSYRQIIEWLDLFVHLKEYTCNKCGYNFRWNKSIVMHPKCSFAFFSKSIKTQERLKRKFIREPNICPICKKILAFQRVKGGFVCPKCSTVKLLKNPLQY